MTSALLEILFLVYQLLHQLFIVLSGDHVTVVGYSFNISGFTILFVVTSAETALL